VDGTSQQRHTRDASFVLQGGTGVEIELYIQKKNFHYLFRIRWKYFSKNGKVSPTNTKMSIIINQKRKFGIARNIINCCHNITAKSANVTSGTTIFTLLSLKTCSIFLRKLWIFESSSDVEFLTRLTCRGFYGVHEFTMLYA
jgi:hypothetical protein